ncbi:MAG TPA: hypothetical protein VF329_08865 [Gammaproteobacteria bacterium]
MLHLIKRLEAAVRTLVGEGPVKQRLHGAYARYLDDLSATDVPEPIRARFESLHAAMHRSPAMGREGAIKISVQKMSFTEAARHAESIVELYADVLRNTDRAEPLKVVHNEEKRYLGGRT